MKVAIWALVIVGVYFVYQYTVGAVFRKYEICYDNAAITIENTQTSETNTCIIEKLTYAEMNRCIQQVQKESNFASFLYEASKAKKNIDADIATHNELCPSNEVDPPGEAFYLSSGS